MKAYIEWTDLSSERVSIEASPASAPTCKSIAMPSRSRMQPAGFNETAVPLRGPPLCLRLTPGLPVALRNARFSGRRAHPGGLRRIYHIRAVRDGRRAPLPNPQRQDFGQRRGDAVGLVEGNVAVYQARRLAASIQIVLGFNRMQIGMRREKLRLGSAPPQSMNHRRSRSLGNEPLHWLQASNCRARRNRYIPVPSRERQEREETEIESGWEVA